MLGIHSFTLFIASGLLLNISPGADMLYIISRSAARGTHAGMLAALGIATGIMVHVAFAVAGLSAILATSALAFLIVKYAGAAYLVYMGVVLLLKRDGRSEHTSSHTKTSSFFQIYEQGVLVNLLNPKISLFFLAFLPQFIDEGSSGRSLAFLVLGLTFAFNGTCVNILVAWLAVSMRRSMAGGQVLGRWLRTLMGATFIGLGMKLAVSARS